MTRRRSEEEQRAARIAAFEKAVQQGGATLERLPEAEATALWRRWRETFSQPVKAATGEWVHLGYHWHAFSYGYTHALSLDTARTAYRARWEGRPVTGGQALVLLPLEDETLAYRCRSDRPLELGRDDCNVCPPDFEWTMAFTHEDGWLGPYFSTREWVAHPPQRA
jgi:hypothetical protein